MATDAEKKQQLDNYTNLYAQAVAERADPSTGNPLADTVGKDFDAAYASIEQRQKRTGASLSPEQMREQAWQVVGTQTQKQRVSQMQATLDGSEVPAVGKDDVNQGLGLFAALQSGDMGSIIASLIGLFTGPDNFLSNMFAPVKKYGVLAFQTVVDSFADKPAHGSWAEREAAYDADVAQEKQNARLGELAKTMGMSVTDLAKVVNGKAETSAPIEAPAAAGHPVSMPVSGASVEQKSAALKDFAHALVANWGTNTDGLYAGEGKPPLIADKFDALIITEATRVASDQLPKDAAGIKAFIEGNKELAADYAKLSPEQKALFDAYAPTAIAVRVTKEAATSIAGEAAVKAVADPINATEGDKAKLDAAAKNIDASVDAALNPKTASVAPEQLQGEQLKTVLTALDKDKDGKISHKELGVLKLTDNIEIAKLAEFIEKDPKLKDEVSRAVDANKDGKISVAEVAVANVQSFAPDNMPMLRGAAKNGIG